MPETIEQIFVENLNKILAGRPHGFQKDLAYALGVSTSYLNNILKGRRGGDEDFRRKTCKALGLDYEDLLFGKSGPPREISSIAKGIDDDLREFMQLYHDYGSPAFLRSCIKRLQEIRELTERDLE